MTDQPPPANATAESTPSTQTQEKLTPRPKVVEVQVREHKRHVYQTKGRTPTALADKTYQPPPAAPAAAEAPKPPQDAAKPAEPPTPPPAETKPADSQPAAPDAKPVEEPKPDPDKEAKEAGEHSSKLSKLIERERKFSEEKMAWSKEREAEKAAITKDRELVKGQVAKLEAFQKSYQADLIGALQEHLGLTADDLYKAIIADGKQYPNGRPKGQKTPQTAPAVDPRVEQMLKDQEEIKKAFAKQQEESANNDVLRVKAEVIAPFLKDNPQRYKHLVAIEKDNAANEVWTVVQAQFAPLIKEFGSVNAIPQNKRPTFEAAADQLEAFLKAEKEKFQAVDKVESPAPSSPQAPPATQTAKKDRKPSPPLTLSESIKRQSKPNYVVKPRPE